MWIVVLMLVVVGLMVVGGVTGAPLFVGAGFLVVTERGGGGGGVSYGRLSGPDTELSATSISSALLYLSNVTE